MGNMAGMAMDNRSSYSRGPKFECTKCKSGQTTPYCTQCGGEVSSVDTVNERKCVRCGHKGYTKFCEECGGEIREYSYHYSPEKPDVKTDLYNLRWSDPYCGYCGQYRSSGNFDPAKYCGECGHREWKQKFPEYSKCRSCGSVSWKTNYCGRCGHNMEIVSERVRNYTKT